jgi:hypothetical protein
VRRLAQRAAHTGRQYHDTLGAELDRRGMGVLLLTPPSIWWCFPTRTDGKTTGIAVLASSAG